MGLLDRIAPEGTGTDRVPSSELPGARALPRLLELLKRAGVLIAPSGTNGGDPAQWQGPPLEPNRRPLTAVLQKGELNRPVSETARRLDLSPALGAMEDKAFAEMMAQGRGAHANLPEGSRSDIFDTEISESRPKYNQDLLAMSAAQNDPTAGAQTHSPKEADAQNPYTVGPEPEEKPMGFWEWWAMMQHGTRPGTWEKEAKAKQDWLDQKYRREKWWADRQVTKEQKDQSFAEWAEKQRMESFFREGEAEAAYEREAPQRAFANKLALTKLAQDQQREGRVAADAQFGTMIAAANALKQDPQAAMLTGMGMGPQISPEEQAVRQWLAQKAAQQAGYTPPQPSFQEQKLQEAGARWRAERPGVKPNAVNIRAMLIKMAQETKDKDQKLALQQLGEELMRDELARSQTPQR